MYTFEEFQSDILQIAKEHDCKVSRLRDTDIPQVDFRYKKLHGNHFRKLFPGILADNTNINKLIEEVVPGRPCTHRLFREIVKQIKRERPDD